MAHIKLCEPINIGCMVYVKELQEMAIRNHANRECSLRKDPVLNYITKLVM